MDDRTQQIFLFEIRIQCEIVERAAAWLEASEALASKTLAAGSNVDPEVMQRRLKQQTADEWLALQTIAVSGANLSKLLWGSGGKRSDRRAPLRTRLQVDDDSVLRSPDLRNDFEHFDERIEMRFGDEQSMPYIGRNIGRESEIQVEGEEPKTRFGHYDPVSGDLSFWANSINVFEIAKEVQRLGPLAEEEALKARWV